MRCSTILAVVLALSGAPIAAAAAVSKPAAAKPVPLTLTPAQRRPALSAEGRETYVKIMSVPDARVTQIRADVGTLRQEKLKLISGTTIDVERLEPLMRREEALESELRTRQNDRLLMLLRALPDPDRVILLQTLANPPKLPNSKPADSGR